MDEFGQRRSDRHRPRSSKRGRPPVFQPTRRDPHPQYVSRRAHAHRGGRGPRRPLGADIRKLVAGLVVVALVGIGIAAFLLTRPARVSIAASPADAMVLFDGSVAATGTLELEDLEPGSYAVYIERAGFEPVTTTVELKRGRHEEATYNLVPLPQDGERRDLTIRLEARVRDLNLASAVNFGAVTDPAGNVCYGCDMAFRILEFAV